MTRLWVSYDNCELYEEHQIDPSDKWNRYWAIEVPNAFGMVPSMLTGGDGRIVEILLRSGIAKKVDYASAS